MWCHLWLGSLGFYKRADWASQGSKPVKNIRSWSLHQFLLPDLLEFLSWHPLVININVESVSWINPFLPNCFLVMMSVQEKKPWLRQILTSFGDEQRYGSVSQINPFLPNLLLGHDVCAGIETLTKIEAKPKIVTMWSSGGWGDPPTHCSGKAFLWLCRCCCHPRTSVG